VGSAKIRPESLRRPRPIRHVLLMLGLALAAAAAISPAGAAAATEYPDAVLLVSGYNSSSAFTTPDAACEGQEGDTWSNPSGPAAALRTAGLAVFTAPVQHGSAPLLPACAPGGTPVPGAGTAIDSYGDSDENGAALASLLAFLHDSYGVERIQLVAHSDGGNWSRSALTQDAAFAGLDVRSLTTLGTPYTGSMVADIGTELRDGRCDFKDPAEQDLCQALITVARQIYSQLGPTAIEQLTHGFLEDWNPEQQIGACPVTTIAGTGVSLPLIPFKFYNPSDGLVGENSALARAALALPGLETIPAPVIPGLRSGGTYPVVHAESLSFINPENLLNSQPISNAVAGIVGSTPAGPLCNGSDAPTAEIAAARAGTSTKTVPFRVTRAASARGFLGRSGVDDIVVARPGVLLRCNGVPLGLLPLLGDMRLRVGYPGACHGPIRATTPSGRGSGEAPALLLHSHPRDTLRVRRQGRRLELSVDGPKVRGLQFRLRRGDEVERLEPDQHGLVRLPSADGSATLTARATTSPGNRRAVASIVLAL
jgi:triacylglycerol lipase